jgi:hypothetical protein
MKEARITNTTPWRLDDHAASPDAAAQVVLIIAGFELRTFLRISSFGLSAPCFGFRAPVFGFSIMEAAYV